MAPPARRLAGPDPRPSTRRRGTRSWCGSAALRRSPASLDGWVRGAIGPVGGGPRGGHLRSFGADHYRTNVLGRQTQQIRGSWRLIGRGNRSPRSGHRPDEDRRDALRRDPPDPRPPPGGPCRERNLNPQLTASRMRHPGRGDSQRPQLAVDRSDSLVSGPTTRYRTPSLLGATGPSIFPAAIRGYLWRTGPPTPLPHANSSARFAARDLRPAIWGPPFA